MRDRGKLGWLGLGLFAAACLVGLYARLDGLGARPLAMDEYFFVRSVDLILESGVPAFETGGYYARGLLLQYATAGLVELFGHRGWVLQLVPLLCGLGSTVLAYFYARHYVGRGLALAVAGALLVSSWHVEFSRFARMYTPFQLLTLAFLLSVHRASVRPAPRPGVRYLPHVLLAVTAFVHEMAILLCPLLFLPLLQRGRGGQPRAADSTRSHAVRVVLAGVFTSIGVAAWTLAEFRDLGVTDSFPAAYQPAAGGMLRFPAPPIWSPGAGAYVDVAIILAPLLIVGLTFWSRGRLRGPHAWREPLLWMVLGAAALHQLSLATVLGLALLARYGLGSLKALSRRERVLLLAAVGLGLVWMASAVAAYSLGLSDRAQLQATFLGFPDLLTPVLVPWLGEFPLLAVVVGAALIYQVARTASGDLVAFLHGPAALVLYFLACTSLLSAPEGSTRYYFHLYPVLLTLVAMALEGVWHSAAARWPRLQPAMPLAIASFVLLFATADDFQPRHLADVPGDLATYRLGPFERFEYAWFFRNDYETPGRYVTEQLRADPAASVVLVTQTPVSYYLDADHAIYYEPNSIPFRMHSRVRGTVELWSNQPLFWLPSAVRDHVAEARTVWLIRPVPTPMLEVSDIDGGRLISAERELLSRDGRIEVVRVRLAPSD